VTFDIDANGIVNVGAKDKGTGREQNIVIQSSGGLAKEEVDRMVREAETFAAADKKKKDFIDAKNDADSLVYSTEKSLAEHRAKVSAEDITEIEAALKDTKKALEGDDGDALRASTQKLQTAAMRIGTAMYKNTGGSTGSSGSGSDGAGTKAEDGRTVDAETSEPKK
jgi:molecular chaperone DnaK